MTRAEKVRIYRARWKRAHPEANRAHLAVARAVKSGRLVKPSTCEMCGEPGRLSGHHDSYEPEDRLRVTWLDDPCHAVLRAVKA